LRKTTMISQKTGDYHEDMNTYVYEKWFSSILCNLEPGSVVVMDNASLTINKIIPFADNQLKLQLLEISRLRKGKYVKYVEDETASVHPFESGIPITVIRLPPSGGW
ncbi:hypothetical protein NQ318_014614, partial [Aromia moschata]